ncbi:MAG TPA: tetratricopeptide repeat-containing glycosyltransferase family protein [Candidatus Acidoferrales bacterium]|nr:tetratricopeptide repeat-containing glycosyltransferase family protein [Candidatus Acidoferrales bacterium]
MDSHIGNPSPMPPETVSRPLDSFDQSLKLAFEMHNAGRSAEAEAVCRNLVQIRPRDNQLLFLLGMILHKSGRHEEAVQCLAQAAQSHPGSARIFSGLGCACLALQQHAQAAAAFEKALALDPRSAPDHYNLGNSYYRLDQVERAVTHFQHAVEINPRDHVSWNNLGKCLKELNRLDESLQAYDRAVEVMPDYPLARHGRAISLLAAGRFLEGFREYEWRWHSMTPRKFDQPVWNGEPHPGKTLFIHAEQGFGDAIQMVRFVSLARPHFATVILECRPELSTLFQYSNCADVIIPYGAPIPSFDYFLPQSSLPRALGITLETIPAQTPYLQAPADTQLPGTPGNLKVGLAWAGNPKYHQDAARSIPLPCLAPIFQVPGIAFYSFQQPVPPRDESFLRSLTNVRTDLCFEDFLQTASAMRELDLLISADTAMAHLAGALGKPVWLLLQHAANWRWFQDREDTPWYPGMRLFRQEKRGDWQPPVARVVEALKLTPP